MLKKILSMMLAVLLVLSMAACGNSQQQPQETTGQPAETTKPTQQTENTTPPDVQSENTQAPATLDSGVNYLSMNYSLDGTQQYLLNAYDNGDGTIYVEMVGEVRKVAYMDPAVMETITQAVADSGAPALHETHEYEDGLAYGGIYISFVDGSMIAADFGGTLPQSFMDVYSAMEEAFGELLKDTPEYVAQPQVMGEVDSARLEALMSLAYGSGIEPLDSLVIMEIPMDDAFGFLAGLSQTDGIVGGSQCNHMMMTTAYSCVIVTAEDASETNAIVRDFSLHVDWLKWVCVAPTHAFVAVKDNMVLCVMGSDQLYYGTKSAADADGWTILEELENPNM